MMLRLIMPKIPLYKRALQIRYRAINQKNIWMLLNATFGKVNYLKSLGLTRHRFIANIQTLQARFKGHGFIQEIIDALTAVPEVWSKTALLINFDENDGYFDHMPSPSAPSRLKMVSMLANRH